MFSDVSDSWLVQPGGGFRRFYVIDVRRTRRVATFEVADEDAARIEFASWYRLLTGPERWEQRKFGRYFLYEELRDESGELVPVPFLSVDEDVRLDYEVFRACDPPHDAASAALLDADFRRLDDADAARLAARQGRVEFFDGKPIYELAKRK